MTKRPAPPPAAIRQPNGKRKRQPHAAQPAQPPRPVRIDQVHRGALATALALAEGDRARVHIITATRLVVSDPRYP